MSKLTVFAVGGTGANIAKRIGDLDINVVFVDTSESNLKSVTTNNVFLVEGMDGAGKKMADTYENFKDIATDVFLKHPPSEFLNVATFRNSDGGGFRNTSVAMSLKFS